MMVVVLRNSRVVHRWAQCAAIAAVALTIACEGCEGCDEPAAPDLGHTATPDVRPTEDEPQVDTTAIARELAEADAEKISVRVGDSARAVAGEIEAELAKRPKPKKPARPKIKDEPETGKLARAQLNKVFSEHGAAMKSCYERSLKRTPGLMGKVRLELLVKSDGDVRTATARGISLRDDAVSSCMERQALTMKFPPPEGGALRVNKTYSFTPDF